MAMTEQKETVWYNVSISYNDGNNFCFHLPEKELKRFEADLSIGAEFFFKNKQTGQRIYADLTGVRFSSISKVPVIHATKMPEVANVANY
jgi:hypothetical protein